MRVLFVDHYDSFSFNVIDLLEKAGVKSIEHQYFDKLSVNNYSEYDFVVLSPGPNHPKDVPQTVELFKKVQGRVPVLGICLGHQVIMYSLGVKISKALEPLHGSTKEVFVDSQSNLFQGEKDSIKVPTYNSLCAYRDDFEPFSGDYSVVAWGEDGSVEAVERNAKGSGFVASVQFHPESFLSEFNVALISNFIKTISPKH